MLSKLFGALFALLLAVGCERRPDDEPIKHGEIRLQLTEFDDKSLSVIIVNRSESNIVINGLFAIGYAQSPIVYDIKNSSGLEKSRGHEISMPVLVDPEMYQVTLHSGGIYGSVFGKDDFASLYELSNGQCYDIRAVYKPSDQTNSKGFWTSDFRHVCF